MRKLKIAITPKPTTNATSAGPDEVVEAVVVAEATVAVSLVCVSVVSVKPIVGGSGGNAGGDGGLSANA